MTIRKAVQADLSRIHEHDIHISERELAISVSLGRIYIAEESGEFAGWLRYNLFWDNTPFMNMLYVLDDYRGKGLGKSLVERWEDDMRMDGYNTVLTSTQSDEFAQHFYVKLGYRAIGGFAMGEDPYELIFMKAI